MSHVKSKRKIASILAFQLVNSTVIAACLPVLLYLLTLTLQNLQIASP